jgi:alpha-L-fucosidase
MHYCFFLLVFNGFTQIKTNRMSWWEEAKFGMLIHRGVITVPVGTYDGKQIDGIG